MLILIEAVNLEVHPPLHVTLPGTSSFQEKKWDGLVRLRSGRMRKGMYVAATLDQLLEKFSLGLAKGMERPHSQLKGNRFFFLPEDREIVEHTIRPNETWDVIILKDSLYWECSRNKGLVAEQSLTVEWPENGLSIAPDEIRQTIINAMKDKRLIIDVYAFLLTQVHGLRAKELQKQGVKLITRLD